MSEPILPDFDWSAHPVEFCRVAVTESMSMQASSRKAMSSMHYFAAWTECGCLLGCSHEHETIVEADSCIPCASGSVVAVENGVMRSLTAEEEAEFQRVH